MLVFNKYFYKKKKSKLSFEDRITVLNDLVYQTGGSITLGAPGGGSRSIAVTPTGARAWRTIVMGWMGAAAPQVAPPGPAGHGSCR
jgi:hypothetical protein